MRCLRFQQPCRSAGFLLFAAGLLLLSSLAASSGAGQPRQASRRVESLRPELVLQRARHAPSWLLFSPDGKTVIAGGSRIHLWDLPSRTLRRTLESPLGPLTALAMSPDDRTLAAAHGSQVLLWDVSTGKQRLALDLPALEVLQLAFSPDGRRLCLGCWDGTVFEWDLQRRERVREYVAQRGFITALVYARDGKRLAIGSGEQPNGLPGLQVWDPARGTLLWVGLPGTAPRDLSYSPDGKRLAAATGGTLVFEGETGKILARPAFDGYSETVAFDPTGAWLARGAQDHIQLLHTSTWEPAGRAHAEGEPTIVRWSPNGKQVASVGFQRVIHLSSPGTPGEVVSLGETPPHLPIIASSAGRLLAFKVGTKLQVFDCLQGALRPELPNEPSAGPEGFLPGTHTLIGAVRHYSGDPRGEFLRFWDLDQAGGRPGELPPYGPRGTWRATDWFAAFPDGRRLVTADNGGVFHLWDTRTLKLLRTIQGPSGRVFSATVAGNRYLVAVNPDGRGLSLWDLENGEKLWSKTGFPGEFRRLAVSPDGKLLVVHFQTREPVLRHRTSPVHLYRLPEGTLTGALSPPARTLSALEFSPDGSLLATGEWDGRIQWWDLANRTPGPLLAAHAGAVTDLAFTPAGDLLSTGADGTVRLWDLRTGRWRLTWTFDVERKVDTRLNGWLVTTPEGIYAAQGSAGRLIRWRRGDQLLPGARFEAELHRPERVQAILTEAFR